MRGHAAARLAERYGVRRNAEGVVSAAKAIILSGEAKFCRHLHSGRSEWRAHLAGKRVRVVWEESTRTVITVLPRRRKWRGKAKREAAEGGGR